MSNFLHMEKFLLIIISSLSFLTSQAQNLGEYFYGDFRNDFIQSTLIENDTVLLAIGGKKNLANGKYEVWFQKINLKNMKPLLEKTFTVSNGSNNNQVAYSLIKTKDNGYLIGGNSFNLFKDSGNGILLKLKNNGLLEWSKVFTELKSVQGVTELSNSSYAICGTNFNEGVIINLNLKGEKNWTQLYEINYRTIIKHIFESPDGKLLIFGRTGENAVGFHGICIIKAEKNGSVIWQKKYDTQFDELHYNNSGIDGSAWSPQLGIEKLPDGNFIVVDSEDESNTAIFKLNPSGDLVWKRIIAASNNKKEVPWSVKLISNGNLLISGESAASYSNFQAYVLIVNEFGKEIKRKYFGNDKGNSRFLSSQILKNGSFLFLGDKSNLSGNNDARGWVMKCDESLNIVKEKIATEIFLDFNKNCQKDAQDIPLKDWIIKTNINSSSLVTSNSKGENEFSFEKDTVTLELLNADDKLWTICNNFVILKYDKNKPLQKITFLVQAKENCPKPEISITQPELVRCNTAKYIVSVKNNGIEAAEDFIAQITLDKDLLLVSASKLYTQKGNILTFNIDKLNLFESQNFELITRLSCNATLSATHIVKAELIPLECVAQWVNAKIEIKGNCENSLISFNCINAGYKDMDKALPYKIWQNNFVIKKGVLQLKKGERINFSFPANGDTYHFQCEQVSGYPYESYPSATIEGCGLGKSGSYKIGFGDAFRYEAESNVSISRAMNCLEEPNKIQELSGIFGNYHYIRDINYQEYCARIRNTTGENQDSIELELRLNNYDPSTLQVIGASNLNSIEKTFKSNGNVCIKMKGLKLAPFGKDSINADAFVRFKIKPKQDLDHDKAYTSNLVIYGNVFFNEKDNIELHAAWANHYINNQDTLTSQYVLPSNVFTYGGKYYDFSKDIVKDKEGNLFLTSTTTSYSGNYAYNFSLIKTTSQGKVIWQKVYAFDKGSIYPQKGIFNSKNELVITGSFLPQDSTATTSAYEVFITKIDKNGNLIWYKKYKPGVYGNGGISKDLVETSENELVISGYCNNGGNAIDNYLLKLNQQGDIVWKKNYVVNGIAFHGNKIKELADKTLIIAGSEFSTNEYPIYYQKIDKDGNEIWNRYFQLPDTTSFSFIDFIYNDDNSITFLGYSQWRLGVNDYVLSPYFIKFDETGKKILEKRPIVSISKFFEPYGYLIKGEDEIFLYGEVYKDTSSFRSDMGIAKFDKNFDLKWLDALGTGNTEWANDALFLDNNTIALWGFHQSSPNDDNIDCVLAFADINSKGIISSKTIDFPNIEVNCFPNPSQNTINFSIKDIENKLTNPEIIIYNSLGREVIKQKISNSQLLNIDVANWTNGIYFYQIIDNKKCIYSQRFVVIR